MIECFKPSIIAQFEGSLSMLNECVERCPLSGFNKTEKEDSDLDRYSHEMEAAFAT